jgi:tripartite-type tricarboxylate transporter receptor subunit TctC
MRSIRLLLSAACCIALGAAHAQSWPARPVTLMVPTPPGGGSDLIARIVGEKLGARLGQPFVVENRPGVVLVGANLVAKAPPDGRMFLFAPNNIAIAPHILPKGTGGGVDILTDLAPVVMPASTPMILVVNPALGVKTVGELVALAKQKPGVPYASPSSGSPMHIAGALFGKAAGVELVHVPYKGVAPAVVDTVGGQVHVLFISMGGGVAQHLRAGKLTALAVTEKRRSPLLPGVPTLGELGYAGVETDGWFGVFATAGTPNQVIARMNQELNGLLALADVRERMEATGMSVLGGTPEAFGNELRGDYARYGRIVREFNIKPD